jgi:predicted lipid-binding transport protein (Tim44 family)
LEKIMEILFFAVVAALVLGRLYQVLGQKRGAEPPPNRGPHLRTVVDNTAGEDREIQEEAPDNAPEPFAKAAYDGPGAAGIADIAAADRNFTPDMFLDGARQAYTMIVTAYGAGDEAALKPLVDQDVFEVYQGVMAQRRAENAPTIDVVRLSDAKIVDAELNGKIARIDVAFSADLAEGKEGLRAVDEVWTFERAIDSRSPIWLLGAVQTK